MKAALVDKPFGLDRLSVTNVPDLRVSDEEVKIKVAYAGINPVDYFIISGSRAINPVPHIPGTEFGGYVEEVGSKVKGINKGDRVIVYPRIFDGICDLCLSGKEHLCRNGGLIGGITNGGFAEYAVVRYQNVIKIPNNLNWESAVSIPVAALTAFHALIEADVKPGETVVIVGASGNTGQFAVQLAKMMGAKVVAISSKPWVKNIGADEVVSLNQALNALQRVNNGRFADVVIDSIGSKTVERSVKLLDIGGRFVTFGALTGISARMTISEVYSKEIKIIGVTGGTRKEMLRLIEIASKNEIRPIIWKTFNLDDVKTAINSLFSRERNGRILLKIAG
ncbi:Zn-dependent alcohol dehydrogenase [Caldisphaera lagunensis DSM 15908]|uniref:Zn-dependent alcohol dehydrogenase n=1 Tax=Caldisphaera lagunensis (strain DSM 15908 / JCM 11604 / ANMR 0165 / IC-154) TaxID=1056495 RepID=L0ACV8_CALLD|nr:alcohol dehydrogenase catalytic domain-containing protein [Caldisphaera lagunensis]AFZ71264.1 Zn-dependent alcohol dehydrogenase [Caldisphaera lagunensis DSM 15908]